MPEHAKDMLTRLELRIMQIVWQLGSATVTDVQERLDHGPAYTTVQTMLNILEKKGKLTRHLRGRSYLYSAAVSEAGVVGHALTDLVDRMFGGSSEQLVMSLLRTQKIKPDQIERLCRLLDEREGEA